ncbi:MAG: octaprenyl-diphosphate synthase [Pseudohongiellaceae bacterium]
MSVAQEAIIAPIVEGMTETDRILSEVLFVDDTESVAGLMSHVSRFSGKRLRPALVHLCGQLTAEPSAVAGLMGDLATIGAIMESLHMATLLHDDVLDEASVRRKVPTLNDMMGNQVPVLLGDLLYARAFDLSLTLPTIRAAKEISGMTQDLCRGEIEQSAFHFDGQPDEERYFRVIRGKTASMFRTSCLLGAIYGGGDESQAKALAEYGTGLGLAFQIIDDCLDVVGDEEAAGKSLGTDLETGKVTLPIIRLAKGLDARGLAELSELINVSGGPAVVDRRVALRERFDLDSAVAECHQEADQQLHRCLGLLDDFAPGPPRVALTELCTFVLERSH